jgi:hypothetical protein
MDDPRLFERGMKCSLWGQKVADMGQFELITFIGYLDELATDRMTKLNEIKTAVYYSG